MPKRRPAENGQKRAPADGMIKPTRFPRLNYQGERRITPDNCGALTNGVSKQRVISDYSDETLELLPEKIDENSRLGRQVRSRGINQIYFQ